MAETVLVGNLPWMSWNLLLGAAPVALGFVLFRGRHRPSALWWVGVVAFVAIGRAEASPNR